MQIFYEAEGIDPEAKKEPEERIAMKEYNEVNNDAE